MTPSKPPTGINVASDTKAGLRFADMIVDGHKTLESRNSDTLRPYVGKRVAIVRTGEGKAKAIGEVTIGEPKVVNQKQFRAMEDEHKVPKGSRFDINTPTKHLYPMHDPVRYEEERDVGHGIVSRQVIHKAGGGAVQPTIEQMRQALAKGGSAKEPKSTVKAYKLFRVHKDHPGKLFPLFVDANTPVEMNKWVDAKEGDMKDGKVKSKIGALAYRPGWHAGDLPIATHIGEKSDPSKTAPDRRPANHAWAEVEMPNDVDWQSEATKRGTNAQGKVVPVKAHITDQIPKGGHYRYKTNPNMTGNWLIGGSMKVNKVLSDVEVARINNKAGMSDLPRTEPFAKKTFGFAGGGMVNGCIAPDEWKAEEHVNYKAQGGTVSAFDYENPKHVENVANIVARHKDFDQITNAAKHLADALSQGSYKFIEDPRIQSAIKQAGHDGYYINGKDGKQQIIRKAEGGAVLPIERIKAEMMDKFKGLNTLQSIGANEAPSMGIKAYVPTAGSPDAGRMPVGGIDTAMGSLPVGGVDMSKGQPGNQLAPQGMPAGTQPDTVLSCRGEGLPNMRNRQRGNLLVRLKVHVPQNLSQDQRAQIKQLQQQGI